MRANHARIAFTAFSAAAAFAGCEPREGGADRARADTGQTAVTDSKVASVKAADGVEIHYQIAGSGEPALVLVHGWSCDRSYWRAQIDHFAKSHRVIAVDLGGHGESGLGRREWTMAAFGEDVRAAVQAVGPEKVVLVGHSMGGPVVAEAAKLMPGRVAGLVMVDFFTDVDRRYTAKEQEGFLAPMRADFPKMTQAFVRQEMFVPSSDPRLADRIAKDMASAPPAVAVSAMAQLLRYDQGAALASIKAPIRVINSDKWATDLEALRKHRPDISLAVVPAVGHFLMMEEPEEFNRLLQRAVDQLSGQSPGRSPAPRANQSGSGGH
jgi:pimeloyl-ACP methyl ester carboxylesterase